MSRKDYAALKRLLAKTPKVVEQADLEHEAEICEQLYSLPKQLCRLDTIENTEKVVPGFGLALVNAISAAARGSSNSNLLGAVCDATAIVEASDGSRILAVALLRGDLFTVLARCCAAVGRGSEPGGASDSGSSGSTGAGSDGAGGSDGGRSSLSVALNKLVSYFDIYEFVMMHLGQDIEKTVWAELHGALRRSSFLEHAAAALLRTAADLNSMQQPVGVQQQQQQQPQHPPAPQPKQQDQQQVAMWRLHAAAVARFLKSTLDLTRLSGLSFDELCASNRRYRLGEVYGTDYAGAQAVHAAELRDLVSGPGLRALLLACLSWGSLGSGGAVLLNMGWPAKAATATDVAGNDIPLLSLQVATRVFQATVSGRRGAVPVAQPPRGYVNTGSQGCALWPQQQPQPQQVPEEEGEQQRTAEELRLQSAGACAAVAMYHEQLAYAHSLITKCDGPTSTDDAAISGEDWARTVPAVRLLVRLLPEMGTRGAVGRLPGMWTRLVAALPRLLEPEVPEEDAMGLLTDAGLLLRLQLDGQGRLLPLAPLQQWPVAADTAAAQPFGHCPSLSLRCALEAGLLPALERLLRAAFVEQPAAAGGGQAGRQEVLERRARIATCAVGCLLLTSGVFPALLAHAHVAELVPLLATLARVLRRLAAVGDALLLQQLPLFGSVVPTSTCSKLPPVHIWVQLLTALAQQVRVLSEWEASTPPRPQPPAIHLWVKIFCVDVRWLAAAGGAPPPGSAAAQQQRQMQSLMCLWWEPGLVPWHAACLSDTRRVRADVEAILFMGLEHALEAVHLQRRVCRARAHALLSYTVARVAAARAGSSSGDGGGTGDSSGRRAGASADSSRTRSQAVASAAVQYMETAKEEWRLHSADSQLHVRRLCEAAAKLLASEAVLAAKEAEAREEAERGGASSGASAGSAAADSAAGAGDATGSSGGGSSGGGFRRPTLGELLASTGTALLDLIEQDMLCAALAWREQRSAALGSGGGAAGVGQSAPPPPSLPPPPPYVLVPAAARAVLYKYGGLAQRPAMESLLLPLQDEDEEHEGEEGEGEHEGEEEEEEQEEEGEEGEEQEEECAWLCPFLEPAEAASQKVTAEQLQAAEAATCRLLESALAEHMEAWVTEAAVAGLQPQQQRCGSDGNGQSGLVSPCVAERLACALLEEDVQRRQAGAESAGPHTAGAQTEEQAEVVDVKGKGAVVAHSKVCCNPACTSLEGPSALIAPGSGKTCARCKTVTYCCGACQLSHWGAAGGGHSLVCPKLAALPEV